MELKDSSLRMFLKEFHNSDKEEFSKYEISSVNELYLDSESIIDADLIDLEHFICLEKIILKNIYVTDEILLNICKTKNLRKISFYNCKISNLKLLEKANICELVIDECDFEDIYYLNNMDCLEDLYLDNNKTIDLKDLSVIKRLKKLSLSNTEVLTSEYLIYMNDIEYLSINGTGIKSISNLVHFDKLKLLVIDGSQAINNKDFVMMMINNGIDVVDSSNRSVVSYYE